MQRVVFYILITLFFNILILLAPLFFFLLSVSCSCERLIDVFFWFYPPVIFLSMLIGIFFCFRVSFERAGTGWIFPVLISFLGYSPFWLTYLSLSSLWSPRHYFGVISIPLAIGVLTFGSAKFFQSFLRRTAP